MTDTQGRIIGYLHSGDLVTCAAYSVGFDVTGDHPIFESDIYNYDIDDCSDCGLSATEWEVQK